jgi:hypothetical protein
MKARLALCLLLSLGCSGGDKEPAPPPAVETDWSKLPPVLERDLELRKLPIRDEQYQKLCGMGRGDSFFRALCATPRPVITDMASLIALAGLAENRAFALTGNSTSLVKTAVSAVNPRAIIFPRVSERREKLPEMTALGFVRGEPFVEVVSRDTTSGDYNFYLFTFERHCDYEGGCDLASLLTEEVEHGWTAFSVYSEEDVGNTSLDCRSCHQPGGDGSTKILRMQELENPWLHWFPQRFVQRTASDKLLTAQFMEAHAFESAYAGIPISSIQSAVDEGSGAQLEALLVAEGQAQQPNVFDPRIEAEAKDGAASPTWDAQFQISLSGDSIPVPYPQADVTDPALRAASVKSYVDVVSGAAPRDTLLDLRGLFSEDAKQKLGLIPPPDASGSQVLSQICSRCHDGRASTAFTRSNFDVKRLAEMTREEKMVAIARLQEPPDSVLHMPPWRAATLPPAAAQAAIDELNK